MPDSQPAWRESLAAFIAREAKPIEKYGHQPRLYELTRQIAALSSPALHFDDDLIYASAWLHDLGVFTGHRPEDPQALARWDNTAYAIERSPAILLRFGFPAEKVQAVLECIRTHQPSHVPTTVEATLLRDADILEQLGAVGILRTVCKIGRDTRFHTFTDAIASLQHARDTLPALLRLPASRALAEERLRFHSEFLQAVAAEAQACLY